MSDPSMALVAQRDCSGRATAVASRLAAVRSTFPRAREGSPPTSRFSELRLGNRTTAEIVGPDLPTPAGVFGWSTILAFRWPMAP